MSSTLVATGVAKGVESGATGGVGCPRSHPQITTMAKQTAADLQGFTFAPVVKGFQTGRQHIQNPPLGAERRGRASGQSVGAERRGGAAMGRVRFALATGPENCIFVMVFHQTPLNTS